MKKIYLALLALTIGVSVQAQRTLKLKLEIVKPTVLENITTSSSVGFEYKLTNLSDNASDSIEIGDTLKLVDPVSKFSGTTYSTLTNYSYNIVLASTIPKGGTLTITPTTALPFADIETLLETTGAYKTKPFTNNTKYVWFLTMYAFGVGTGNTPLAATGSTIMSDTQVIWINKSTASINESFSAANETIKTYPNPAVNQLSFEYNFVNNENATARILDVTGRTVFVKEFENNTGNQKFDLDINSLNTGSYLLQFIVGDKTMTNKFNVQK